MTGMYRLSRLCIAFAVLLLTGSLLEQGAASASETLRINTSIKPPFSNQDETGFFDRMLHELGRRLGVQVELVRLPPERALLAADSGESDGDLPRIGGLSAKYVNLVQVEEPVVEYEFIAFGRTCPPLAGWDDLEHSRVGYLLGWKIYENNVPTGADVARLRRPDLLMAMLREGRIDLALYERFAGRELVRGGEYGKVRECESPLAVKPMYLYLHKDKSHFAQRAASALRDMKRDGFYDVIVLECLCR